MALSSSARVAAHDALLVKLNYRPAFIALLLVYWLTRLYAIDLFAFFIDEGVHLWYAQLVWVGSPFHPVSDGRLLNSLWMAAFYPFNANIFIARLSVIFIAVAGLACLLDTVRRVASPWAALAAGILYTAMPLTFFFERLALADSLSAPFVMAACWAMVRARDERSLARRWMWLGGIALFCALVSKISNFIFLCIPAAAILFLFDVRQWRVTATLMAHAYGAFAALLVPLALFLRFAVKSDLGLSLFTRKTQTSLVELPARFVAGGEKTLDAFAHYLPFPLWLAVLALVVFALWRGGRAAWFFGSALGATLFALIVGSSPGFLESRFLPAYAPLMAVLGAMGMRQIATRKWRGWVGGALAASLITSGMFLWKGWTDPLALPLTAPDRWQYITGWPSGYAFNDLAQHYLSLGERVTLSTLDLGGEQRLTGYLDGRSEVVATRQYQPGMPLDGVLLIVDTPKDNAELPTYNLDLIEVARFPRPGGESALVVYRER